MTRQISTFITLSFFIQGALAQTNQGSRLTAMGQNGGAVKDIWGVEANPATIVDVKTALVQLNYQKHFLATELSQQALAIVYPLSRQKIGLNLQRYGIQEYQNMEIGIIFTRQFGDELSIGIRANYHYLSILNYGSTFGISLDIGTLYQLNDKLGLGFYITNISRSTYSTQAVSLTIPSVMYLGFTYKTSDKLLIASTISKQLQSFGFDYQLITQLSIRSGISLSPLKHYSGVGFSHSKLLADITFSRDQNLGYSPQISVGYAF